MSLFRRSYRADRTRHASVVRPLFLSFGRTPFNFKTHHFKIFMAAAANSLICCAHALLPMPTSSTRRSARRRYPLPLVLFSFLSVFLCLVRFGRSSRPCLFSSLLCLRSSPASIVVPPSAFSCFPHYRAVVLLVIDAHIHTSPTRLNCLFQLRHYLHTYTLLSFICSVLFRISLASLVGRVPRGPTLMRVGSLRHVVEFLTSW